MQAGRKGLLWPSVDTRQSLFVLLTLSLRWSWSMLRRDMEDISRNLGTLRSVFEIIHVQWWWCGINTSKYSISKWIHTLPSSILSRLLIKNFCRIPPSSQDFYRILSFIRSQGWAWRYIRSVNFQMKCPGNMRARRCWCIAWTTRLFATVRG